MCQKTFWGLMAVIVAGCIALAVTANTTSDAFAMAVSFPLLQCGQLLRTLSLSGALGNVLALTLYAVISTAPLLLIVYRYKRHRLQHHDVLLAVLSVALFYSLYITINPALLVSLIPHKPLFAPSVLLGTLCYSIVAAYFILDVVQQILSADQAQLHVLIKSVIQLLIALSLVVVFYLQLSDYVHMRAAISAPSHVLQQPLLNNDLMLSIKFLTTVLPYLLLIWLLNKVIALLEALQQSPYSQDVLIIIDVIKRQTTLALQLIIYSGVAFNCLQLIVIRTTTTLDLSINLPVVSILIIAVILLFTHYLQKSKALKEDLERFV